MDGFSSIPGAASEAVEVGAVVVNSGDASKPVVR